MLVTGANGFVGRWLVQALAERGASVGAFTGPPISTKNDALPFPEKGVQTVEGSVTDLKLFSGLLAEHKFDVIYHLAASNVNTGSQISPYDVYETNTRGVYTVLEAARLSSHPVSVVVASSKEVEDCFLSNGSRKFHPYMTSKASAEMITRTYADTYGVAAAVLRSENIYGGGDFNWNRLVPSTIQSILQGRTPVIKGDGRVRRDYIYIEDAVAAYLALGARLPDAGIKGRLFRIATGSSVSVLEMVREILRAAGRQHVEPQVLGEATDSRVDVPYQPDLEKATLGWQSRHTLAEGLKRTWEWYQTHPGKN